MIGKRILRFQPRQSGQEQEQCPTLKGRNAGDFVAPKLNHGQIETEEFEYEMKQLSNRELLIS